MGVNELSEMLADTETSVELDVQTMSELQPPCEMVLTKYKRNRWLPWRKVKITEEEHCTNAATWYILAACGNCERGKILLSCDECYHEFAERGHVICLVCNTRSRVVIRKAERL